MSPIPGLTVNKPTAGSHSFCGIMTALAWPWPEDNISQPFAQSSGSSLLSIPRRGYIMNKDDRGLLSDARSEWLGFNEFYQFSKHLIWEIKTVLFRFQSFRKH